jgi:hypothetical protein
MISAHAIRLLVNQRSGRLLVSSVQRTLTAAPFQCLSNRVAYNPTDPPKLHPAETGQTTGWDRFQFPQHESLQIMRRAAQTEDAKIERRRRIQLFKIIVAIGAVIVLYFTFGFLMYTLGWFDISL